MMAITAYLDKYPYIKWVIKDTRKDWVNLDVMENNGYQLSVIE